MTRKEILSDRLDELGVDEKMSRALCNWMSADELEKFVEFLEEEL